MIRINITGPDASVTEKETLTAGRAGLQCEFTFDSAWDGLNKMAICEGAEIHDVVLDPESNVITIPEECMSVAGYRLRIGVYGVAGDRTTVIPTVWAKVGKIQDSADGGGDITSVTPDVAAQILQNSNDALMLAREAAEKASAVETAGAEQVALVNAAGAAQAQAVEDAGRTATTAVSDAQAVAAAAIQQEGSAQQAAVQEKGEEVLASIPADYTELDGEVDDLKSAINSVSGYGTNLFDPSTATDNNRLSGAGTLVETTSGNLCFTSDYIPVEPGFQYLKNSLEEAAFWRVCYYDASKAFLSASNDNLTTAPENAAYARFCGYMSYKASSTFFLVTAVDYAARKNAAANSEALNDLAEMVSNVIVQGGLNLYDQSAQMDGYQLWSSGNLGENANYCFSGYIDVDGNDNITVYLYGMHVGNYVQYAFYDSAKAPVQGRTEDLYGSTAKTITVPANAAYFGFAYPKANWTEDQGKAMVQSGTEHTDWEPFGSGTFIYPSNETKNARGGYDTLGDRLDALTPPDESNVLVYWGDSLTEGNQSGDGGSIPGTMRTLLPNWTIHNFGRGGDMANSIACRQGGMNFVVKAGQTLPASGSVTLELTDNIGTSDVGVRLYDGAYAYDSLNPCYIAGVKGKLLRVSSAYPLNQGIFTRETAGDAVPIDRPTAVISNGKNYKGYTLVISAGTNRGFDVSKPQELVDIIRWMVNYAEADKYLVMGLYHGTNNSWQANCNAALQAEFGRHFIDAEAYMKTPIYSGDTIVSSYALADESLTPTAEDLTAIGANTYPPQIMYDAIHFNKWGYDCIAKLQYKRGQELGYWA